MKSLDCNKFSSKIGLRQRVEKMLEKLMLYYLSMAA